MLEILIVALSLMIFLLIVSLVFSNIIVVRKYTVHKGKIADNIRIVYLADLFLNNHNFRVNQIIEKTKKCNPDIIIVSGKTESEKKGNINSIFNELSKISSLFCVFSNNPVDSQTYIENNSMKIFDDYSILPVDDCSQSSSVDVVKTFSKLDNLKIVVCKTPSQFEKIVSQGEVDIVLSSRGGRTVINIPFFGVVYSSSEGFMPKYQSRHYVENDCHLIATIGVGKSTLPLRLSDFREISCIDIKK